jgi:hypothetical protein
VMRPPRLQLSIVARQITLCRESVYIPFYGFSLDILERIGGRSSD